MYLIMHPLKGHLRYWRVAMCWVDSNGNTRLFEQILPNRKGACAAAALFIG